METKGLLHFEITLESREYSSCEHVHECLLHIVICGANFNICKTATSSHFKPGLLGDASLTWLPLNLRSFIHEIHHSSRFPNEGFSRFPNSAGSWFPDFR
jgi:hypothetical protein